MNQNEFGYRVRQALNEATERLDYRTLHRLEKARSKALAAHRAQAAPAWRPVLAAPGAPSIGGDDRGSWLQRLGLAAPLLALVVGFVGIYEWQHARYIQELADIDFAMLLDQAPIDAYADKGFGALLQSNTEEL